jgi:hypothetical protein
MAHFCALQCAIFFGSGLETWWRQVLLHFCHRSAQPPASAVRAHWGIILLQVVNPNHLAFSLLA